MDFAEAVEFSKKFRTCNPKVFKGFIEWGICDAETDGYVVLADATLARKSYFSELEDYVKSHKLRIDFGEDYLMVSTLC
ncbi:MAG: hypothetical protein ABSF44_07225 [Candidatus Bathyarchaeia archaeon]|jgi:hypothetical protein